MIYGKQIIASITFFLIVAAVILSFTTEFTGLGYFEALKDQKSLTIALSVPLVILMLILIVEQTKILERTTVLSKRASISISVLGWCLLILLGGTISISVTTLYSKLGFGEALTDIKSLNVTLIFLLLASITLWIGGKLPHSLTMPPAPIKKAILPNLFWSLYFVILLPCYLFYGYFSYFYLVHSEFPPQNMYSDISQALEWFTGHYVLIIVFAIVLFVGLLLKTLLGRAAHFSINWVMKAAGHDVVEISEDEFIEAQKMITALEREKRSDQD